MNPLVNTDVHRYVKDLIDRHIAGTEGAAQDSADPQHDLADRAEDISPPADKEKVSDYK